MSATSAVQRAAVGMPMLRARSQVASAAMVAPRRHRIALVVSHAITVASEMCLGSMPGNQKLWHQQHKVSGQWYLIVRFRFLSGKRPSRLERMVIIASMPGNQMLGLIRLHVVEEEKHVIVSHSHSTPRF